MLGSQMLPQRGCSKNSGRRDCAAAIGGYRGGVCTVNALRSAKKSEIGQKLAHSCDEVEFIGAPRYWADGPCGDRYKGRMIRGFSGLIGLIVFVLKAWPGGFSSWSMDGASLSRPGPAFHRCGLVWNDIHPCQGMQGVSATVEVS